MAPTSTAFALNEPLSTTAYQYISHSSVSVEAVAFLGFVAVCLVLLIIFFMYLNKMFCFRTIGGFPCVDRPPKKRFDPTTGREYGVAEEDDDDDCDSEDDAVNQFQRHRSMRMSSIRQSKLSKPIYQSEQTVKEDGQLESNPNKEDGAADMAAASAVAAAVDQLSSALEDHAKTAVAEEPSNFTETQPILAPVALDTPNAKELSVELAFCYFMSRGDLTVNIKQVKNTPNPDWQYQIHVTVLPTKKYTFRTSYEKGDNPLFLSLFTCHVLAESLPDTYVRVRLYGRPMMLTPAKLIGAAIISMATLPLDVDVSKWAQLQPSEEGLWAIDLVENESDQQQQKDISRLEPSIIVGLAYSALTGRLAVEIGEAHGINKLLRQMPQKLETYVKILVMLGPSADRLLAQTKTRLSKGSSPTYKEKFVFQVAQFQLADVSLGIMIYTRRRENIGWVAIGSAAEENSSESTHWAELRAAAATHSPEMLTRVHRILPPEQGPGSKTVSMTTAARTEH